MKYAILYSGHLRTLLDTIENHKNNISNYHEFDIYLNFWDCWGNGYVLKEYQYEDNDVLSDETKDLVISLINPKFYEFETYNSILDDISNIMKLQDGIFNSNKIRNVISMYYKLERGFYHIKNSGIHYDGILRLRPDLYFTEKINLLKPEKNTIYTSLEPRWCINGFGVNDQFAFGDMESIEKYCTLYSNLKNIWEQNPYLNCAPETLLKIHLNKFDVKIKDIIDGDVWLSTQIHNLMRENKVIE